MKKLIAKLIGAFLNVTAPITPKWNANYGFKLLCRVRRVGISERGKQFLATATTQFIEADGHTAALHRWGNGPKKILFLHGWMSNSQRWQPYVDKIDLNEYTVYALDAPGHGLAKGNQLNIETFRKTMLQAIDLAGAVDTLVCHSLGSLVGAYAFLVDTKIAIGSYVIMGTPTGMGAIFSYFKELLGLSNKTMKNLSVKVNAVLKIPYEEINMERFFKKVDVPVLVVHDRNDSITPFPPIENSIERKDQIEKLITNGLKHDLKSEEVYDRVIQFIDEKSFTSRRTHSA